MLVEHARTLMGIDDAAHAETSGGGTQVVSLLSCSLDGQIIDVALTPGTRLSELHDGAATARELTTCNYGLAPEWQHIASEGGMVVSAVDGTGEVRAVERTDHPFFVGTLYQPQLRSTAAEPHPVFVGFLRACRDHAAARVS